MSPFTRRQFIGATAGLAVAANSEAGSAYGLHVEPRSSWGDDLPPRGALEDEDVRFLIVHHSASHNGHTAADVPGILRSWYHFHTGPDKGWPDIAYNFIIDSAGGVWEGRQGSLDGPVAGSATGGNQGFTQLVCVIGDTNEAPVSSAAQTSLGRVLAWLADRYDVSTVSGAEVTFISRGSNRWSRGTAVTTPTIVGHRDMSQTTCPGADLYSYVTGSLRADVEALRNEGSSHSLSPATTTTVPPTTTAVVGSTSSIPTPDTTSPPPGSSAPLAEPSPRGSTAPLGMLATAGALVLGGAGLVIWRYRRMGGSD